MTFAKCIYIRLLQCIPVSGISSSGNLCGFFVVMWYAMQVPLAPSRWGARPWAAQWDPPVKQKKEEM